jgi:hypothetical protein
MRTRTKEALYRRSSARQKNTDQANRLEPAIRISIVSFLTFPPDMFIFDHSRAVWMNITSRHALRFCGVGPTSCLEIGTKPVGFDPC